MAESVGVVGVVAVEVHQRDLGYGGVFRLQARRGGQAQVDGGGVRGFHEQVGAVGGVANVAVTVCVPASVPLTLSATMARSVPLIGVIRRHGVAIGVGGGQAPCRGGDDGVGRDVER